MNETGACPYTCPTGKVGYDSEEANYKTAVEHACRDLCPTGKYAESDDEDGKTVYFCDSPGVQAMSIPDLDC